MGTPSSPVFSKKKAILYVDGFNLFHSLQDNDWKHYYWLDLQALAAPYIGSRYELCEIKYFCAQVEHMQEKLNRQRIYLKALGTLPNLSLHKGYFQKKKHKCVSCKAENGFHVEKKTDVNIATELLTDFFLDKFDKAIVITGDNDLYAPLLKIRDGSCSQTVTLLLPPKRPDGVEPIQLTSAVDTREQLTEDSLKNAQFPDKVQINTTTTITRPSKWVYVPPVTPEEAQLQKLKLKFNK